jgi:hypothetical protein
MKSLKLNELRDVLDNSLLPLKNEYNLSINIKDVYIFKCWLYSGKGIIEIKHNGMKWIKSTFYIDTDFSFIHSKAKIKLVESDFDSIELDCDSILECLNSFD